MKNYTTTVAAKKSVREIEDILEKFKIFNVKFDKTNEGRYVQVSFEFDTGQIGLRTYRVCPNVEVILAKLKKTNLPKSKLTIEHAYNVAWRNAKDYVHIMLSMVEDGIIEHTHHALFPFLVKPSGEYFMQDFDRHLALPSPNQ